MMVSLQTLATSTPPLVLLLLIEINHCLPEPTVCKIDELLSTLLLPSYNYDGGCDFGMVLRVHFKLRTKFFEG